MRQRAYCPTCGNGLDFETKDGRLIEVHAAKPCVPRPVVEHKPEIRICANITCKREFDVSEEKGRASSKVCSAVCRNEIESRQRQVRKKKPFMESVRQHWLRKYEG